MAVLSVAKQELYAKHRANGFMPKKAAQAAGYASGSAIYQALEDDVDVAARINELIEERQIAKAARLAAAQAKAVAEGQAVGSVTGVSHAWVIEQLQMNAEDAREAGDFKESNASIKLIGEHLGMWNGGGHEGNGAGGGGQGGAQLIDLDSIDKLTAAADRALNVTPAAKGLPMSSEDQAITLALIEGQGRGSIQRKPLTTGSETDAALEALEAMQAAPALNAKKVDEAGQDELGQQVILDGDAPFMPARLVDPPPPYVDPE